MSTRATDRRFLVALPVRNGGDYVKSCIASVLAQTHAGFRLIVLDNASEDGTAAYARSLGDPRVVVQESPVVLDMEDSWRRVVGLDADEEFLTIIGHDDLLDPQFLARMAALIDARPDAALYTSRFRLIDARGRTIRSSVPIPALERRNEFLAARLDLRRDSFGPGYVCRLADYRRLGGIPAYPKLMFADDALWLALMGASCKACEPRESFSYRLHAASTSGSPPWRPTFAALNAYLDLLFGYAATDEAVARALREGIVGYLSFWSRWGSYTATVPEDERSQIKAAIDSLPVRVRAALGSETADRVDARLRSDLQSALPRLRWFLWRIGQALRMRARGYG